MTKLTKDFIKQLKRFDKSIKDELYKAVEKVVSDPQCGKPLRNRLGGCFEERVRKYRILYTIKQPPVIDRWNLGARFARNSGT